MIVLLEHFHSLLSIVNHHGFPAHDTQHALNYLLRDEVILRDQCKRASPRLEDANCDVQ